VIAVLKRVLGLDDILTTDEAPAAVNTVDAARDRLKQALADEAARKAELESATAALARTRDVIAAADEFEDEAKIAAQTAEAATAAWALAGASPDAPSGDEAALDRAADAQRKAIQARLKARGAESALGGVIQAESDARYALIAARGQVQIAVRDVLLSELEPHFATLERARMECESAHLQVPPALLQQKCYRLG
jgi:hypothetical protein